MKYRGTIFLLCLCLMAPMAGCSSGSSAECESNQDCEGDPGENCHWTCVDNECVPVCEDECQTAEDCADLEWPINCPGIWECNGGECQAVCTGCTGVADCLSETWEVACVGHWSCVGGECEEECDSLNCGDGVCDSAIGEAEDTCPEDCRTDCQVAADCRSLEWLESCSGHWTCQAEVCLEECDSVTCPDGDCDPDLGESGQSCPEDCGMSCITALDCSAHTWPLPCEGHWECQRGQCEPVCGELNPCQEAIDCVGYTWQARCLGHWACENNICEVVCGDGCGDDVCSPENGESEESCSIDCGVEPECQQPADCLDLPWLSDCPGHWDCDLGTCVEVCDFVDCGDGYCDEAGGESAESCADDCVEKCVDEGFAVDEGQECCPGLDRIQEWIPGDITPNPVWFCLACGDGECDAHENVYTCDDDCTWGCDSGEAIFYDCDNGTLVTWCECKEPECPPVCLYEGTYSEGWYNSCTEELYHLEICIGCDLECRYPGTDSEAWWPVCPNSPVEPQLIEYAFCMEYYSCLYDPTEQCP